MVKVPGSVAIVQKLKETIAKRETAWKVLDDIRRQVAAAERTFAEHNDKVSQLQGELDSALKKEIAAAII